MEALFLIKFCFYYSNKPRANWFLKERKKYRRINIFYIKR